MATIREMVEAEGFTDPEVLALVDLTDAWYPDVQYAVFRLARGFRDGDLTDDATVAEARLYIGTPPFDCVGDDYADIAIHTITALAEGRFDDAKGPHYIELYDYTEVVKPQGTVAEAAALFAKVADATDAAIERTNPSA